MKYAGRLIMILTVAVLMSGCSDNEKALVLSSNPTEESSDLVMISPESPSSELLSPEPELKTKVSWKVVDYGGPPYFHLSIILNEEEEYYAGYFWGENFGIGERADTPDNALSAAGSYWTGVGELFYIYQKNETELAVMNHHAPYGTQPEEWEAYREILSIPIEKDSSIEIGEVVYVEESYAWPGEYSFILYDSFVLGGRDRNNKLVPILGSDLESYRDKIEDWGFRLFKDGQYLDTVSYYGFENQWLDEITTEYNDISNVDSMEVKLEYKGAYFDGLAINDAEPVTFGPKAPIDPSAQVYVDYIAQILAEHGLEGEPVHIQEIIRTDLEGDGVEEVLIVASNNHTSDIQKGQYSVAVLRKVIDGKVESLFLVKYIFDDLPEDITTRLLCDYKLLEVVDLNHDGICELLISESYYEGEYYLVYSLTDGQFELVMDNGFGL